MSFQRSFGRTGRHVSAVGLGGEGVLRTFRRTDEALAVIREAMAQGITYFDSARAYAGSEGYYGAFWSLHEGHRPSIFQASKSAMRDRAGARAELDATLGIMGIDHLDLWQIHDVRTWGELQMIEGPGGALEAFSEARATGRADHIGVTGHHDPAILTYAVQNWDLDSVLMPVNPVEGILGGFMDSTLQAAEDQGMAVIGMKVLGASQYLNRQAGVTAEKLIRYALSQDVSLITVGCSTPREVQALALIGRSFEPMTAEEEHELLDVFRPFARRLAFYRGSIG